MIEFKDNMLGSTFWLNSQSLNFFEIQKLSNVQNNWQKRNIFYEDKILQPINQYALYFHNKPEFVINNDILLLRYKTHAEIWLEILNGSLYAVDKVSQRQFYPSANKIEYSKDCFLPTFKFYLPWTINISKQYKITNINDEYFYIKNEHVVFNENNNDATWVDFMFKRNDFIEKNKYCIIEKDTVMFDIMIEDKKIIKRILNENE